MEKTLIIVESPAKSKTISRYLGGDYKVIASVGHIRDLPTSTIGVDVKHDFKPRYITMKGKSKVVKELKTEAAKVEKILLATDPDREGEAIAWHISELLKMNQDDDCRISFNEITQNAVQKAIQEPRKIDMDLVNAQQARRILDRLVGYELSPLLWQKIRKGLSAGRVQSVATRMCVIREREIQAFVPEEYWLLTAFLQKQIEDVVFKCRYHGEQKTTKVERKKLVNEAEVKALLADLADKTYKVHKVKKGQRKKQPHAPFTTSTLQQDASRHLGYSSSRTMRIAQQLYEGVDLEGIGATALVTYIRTDSLRVSQEAEAMAKDYIKGKYGAEFLPAKTRIFKNKNQAQDAHEAIRPAHFELEPKKIEHQLSRDQYRLYKLIWDRFMASQMSAAEIDTVTADIIAGTHIFRVKGETIRFAGWLLQYGHQSQEKSSKSQDGASEDELNQETLPELNEGDELQLKQLVPEQKFTLPPARYTEASLIKAMEEDGIGRPSTYAPTISTIMARRYVDKDGRYLVPTELGMIVIAMLEENFGNIVDLTFTAGMEKKLDTVEEGKEDWIELLKQFYPSFHESVEKAKTTIEKIKVEDVPTGEVCPTCGEGELMIKEGRYGKFISCSRYPDCKHTSNIEEKAPAHCPLCGSDILVKTTRKNRHKKFYVCDKKGKDPECAFISWGMPIDDKKCDICGSYKILQYFRGKNFEKCGNPDCLSNQKKKKTEKKDDENKEAKTT